MAEGERSFSGMLTRLNELCAAVSVPVIAKEVGQGMTADAALQFMDCGVQGIDTGGLGGTNFIAVEAWRRGVDLDPDWSAWGVPTACSLAEVLAVSVPDLAVVASGGIRSGHDVAKCLALGASAVGVAGPLLRLSAQDASDERLDAWLEDVHGTLQAVMVLAGAANVADLGRRPVVLGGLVREWLEDRGYRWFVERVARRSQFPEPQHAEKRY